MSQRDHGLVESVAAVPTPTSPRKRQKTGKEEDCDSKHDGAGAGASASASKQPPAAMSTAVRDHDRNEASPTTTSPDIKVEMTIRSQQPHLDTKPSDQNTPPQDIDSPTPDRPMPDEEDAASRAIGGADGAADSPPVIAIDDDGDDERDDSPPVELLPVDAATDPIQIEFDAEDLFCQFPFTQNGNYMGAIRNVVQHLQSGQSVDNTVIPHLTHWLNMFPNYPSMREAIYTKQASFWDEFSSAVSRLLNRRASFGDTFGDDSRLSEEEIVMAFLASYLRCCTQLLQADAQVLERCTASEPAPYPIVSYRHLRLIHLILRPERSNVFHLLAKEYRVDAQEMGARLLSIFLQLDGLKHLLAFAENACGKVPVVAYHNIAIFVPQICDSIGWALCATDIVTTIDKAGMHRDILCFFRRYNGDLQNPSKVADTSQTKDIITHFSNLLFSLCEWDHTIAAELIEDVSNFGDPESPTTGSPTVEINRDGYIRVPHLWPPLIKHAWKFKLLRKYVVKGRMELRVMSIGTMDQALVDIWREYNDMAVSPNHPVMQYLAEFLLHERVVNYIISVDSHPQLISRSGNIVGFLVVTGRYSESQTDAIWNTVSNSSDPRVVSATMTMLRSISNLMHEPDLLYLLTKMHDLPIESFTVEILRFMRDIISRLSTTDWTQTNVKARPWNIYVRVLQDTPPAKDTSNVLMALHTEAAEQLQSVLRASCCESEERYDIYRQCAAHISSRSSKASGSVHAIFIILDSTNVEDATFFEENPAVTRQILEETCAFIRDEKDIAFDTPQSLAVRYRLDLFSLLINRAPKAVPSDMYRELWDHLVGEHAQTSYLRDLAWARFSSALKNRLDNEFYKQLISVYVPDLDPQYYTAGLYEFVAMYRFPTTRKTVETPDGPKELLQIRGADLLWAMTLSAPSTIIADRTATLLASRYLEVDHAHGIKLQEVEEAHVALVEQCTKEMLATYRLLRGQAADDDGQMDVVLSDSMKIRKEQQFTRTVLFLKLLLSLIRSKVEFTRTRRSDSKVEIMDEDLPNGDVVEIRYQIPSGKQQTMLVGLNNTLHDVCRRLCQATGFSKINIFSKGKRVDIAGEGSEKISNLDLVGQHLLVQNAGGSEVNIPAADTSGPCSVFETALLSRFEELFACMDSDDIMSSTLHSLFLAFPFPERIAESIVAGTSSAKGLFPPDKPYQANYACHAINTALDQQLHANTLNEKYLVNGVRLLDEALLSVTLSESSIQLQVDLTNTLIFVFVKFLKERPSTEVSASYFSDEKLLVTRLLEIMSVNLSKESVNHALSPYAAIIEASLHSRGIWDAFTTHPTTPALHKALLLDHHNARLRTEAAKIISSVCGGALSPSSALTEADTATCFWKMISFVIPHSVSRPGRSEQLFELADEIFRKMDEHHRDEATLRSYLADWSELLLSYNHIEVVGKGDTDFIVLGLAKLLLSCISSLKSFKKPLNSGQLIERIWNKFLFIPRIVNVDEQSSDIQIPILESRTRKELFDLLLALAEDRASYKHLIHLGAELVIDEKNMDMRSFDIDRRESIRSATGYLGLNNPRAICYMNSLLAQLFMNANFRKFMLGIDIADPGVSQRLLQETQKLFAKMQNSYRKWADPQAFAACVRVPDGESIDINIQMDADEFYNLLFDQWEAQMISPEIKQQFRSFYGGQTVNQIKSKECEHVSERLESFFVVQCDVQGKSTLNESLQAFVEGDVMEGENKYKCESCGGKLVDAVKRTCLKEVPDNLIFHLKRFDFDLVNLSRAKINDQFDFPMDIDVSPYKIDHLSDPSKPCEEDMFDLVGVLVHQGSSEAGHYYSYIRSRPCPMEGAQQWCEFNDRDVEAFDPQYIPARTYGGAIDQYQRQLKNYSAYMLFYQRRSAIAKDRSDYSDSLRSGVVKVPVPPTLKEQINEDNDNCIREYTLYDPYHTKFVRQVLANARKVNHGTCSEDHEFETNALQIVLEHLYQVVVRNRTPESFEESLLQVRKSVLSCAICCEAILRWMIREENALLNMLINCEDAKVRAQSRVLLIDCLRYLREQDPLSYGIDIMETDSDSELPDTRQAVLPAIIERLQNVAETSWLNFRSWDDFYLTLYQISEMGHVETAALLTECFLDFCLQIFCMTASVELQQNHQDMWRVAEKRKRIYNRMIEFVHSLMCKIDLGADLTDLNNVAYNRLDTYDRSTGLFAISKEERHWLHYWFDDNRAYAALDRMLETFDVSKTEVFYPGLILKLMMRYADPPTHQRLYTTVREGVIQLAPPNSDPYVRAALAFCESSTEVTLVDQVIEIVAGVAGKSDKYGGDALFYFISGLLRARNEVVTNLKGANHFFLQSLIVAKKVAAPLLLHDNEPVRRMTAKHFEELFIKWGEDQEIEGDILRIKYKVIRNLAGSLMRKVQEEHGSGTLRSYMQPMIVTCTILNQQLQLLHENDDLVEFRLGSDADLFQGYVTMDSHLGAWAYDEGSPQSIGEGFDQSDYGIKLKFYGPEKLSSAELAKYDHSGSESGSLPD